MKKAKSPAAVPARVPPKILLPDQLAFHKELVGLGPLALQLLLLIVGLWNRRALELKGIAPSYRSPADWSFAVKLTDLHTYLGRASTGRDHRHLRIAIKELSDFHVSEKHRTVNGKIQVDYYYPFEHFGYTEEDGAAVQLRYTLTSAFKEMLEALERKMIAFTLVPRVDAIALQSTRALLVLLIACRAERMRSASQRQLKIDWIRDYLGLTDETYNETRFVLRKVQQLAATVSVVTNCRVSVRAVRDALDRRRIAALEFTVKRDRIVKPTLAPRIIKPKLPPQVVQKDPDEWLALGRALQEKKRREPESCVTTDIDDV